MKNILLAMEELIKTRSGVEIFPLRPVFKVGAFPNGFDFSPSGEHVSPIRPWLPIIGRWLKGS